MARDRRDREGVEQIKELSSRSPMARPKPMAFKRGRDAVSVGASPLEGPGAVSAGSDAAVAAMKAIGIKPWGKDRVTLTLRAQMLMVEQRASATSIAKMNLDYRNRISILELQPGLFLKIEPTGCYRLSYNNR